jgi:hypothetical protein
LTGPASLLTGPTGPTGPSSVGNLDSLSDVLITGATAGHLLAFIGATGANRWENRAVDLENLANVVRVGTPVTGQVLSYDADEGVWFNTDKVRLDHIVLPNEGSSDTSLSIWGPSGPGGGIGVHFNLAGLTGTQAVRFPNASGVLAMQNQLAITRHVGASFEIADGNTGFVTAVCPVVGGIQTKAVGVNMVATPNAVSVRAMTVDADLITARVVAKATDGTTTVTAIAICA